MKPLGTFPVSPLAVAEAGDAQSGLGAPSPHGGGAGAGGEARLNNKHLAGARLSQQGAHSTSCEEMLMIVHTNKGLDRLIQS